MEIRNTKQLRNAYAAWANPSYYKEYSLDEAYGNYSAAKQRAWNYCENLMKEYDGRGLMILGHNCMTFSVGFVGYIDGLKHFFYITRDHDRALPLEKIDKTTGEVISIA